VNYILMVLVPIIPSLLALFGYYKVFTGKKAWKYPLIAIEAVILVAAILLCGVEPFELTIASTATIFSCIGGIAILSIAKSDEKALLSIATCAIVNLILLAYGFFMAVLKWVIMV